MDRLEHQVNLEALSRDSRKWLEAQPAQTQVMIAEALSALAHAPRSPSCRHLKGHLHCLWRIRCGDTRLVYDIDDQTRVISVLRIGHRGKVYER